MKKKYPLYDLLPEFHQTTPGAPLHPLIVAANVQIFLRNYSQLNRMHAFFHERYIMLIWLRGSGKIRINDELLEIRQNEILLIPPFSSHSFPGGTPDYECVMVSFTLNAESPVMAHISGRVLRPWSGFRKKFNNCVEMFLKWYGNTPGADMECCYRLSSLLNQLMIRHSGYTLKAHTFIDHEQELLKAALNMVQQNIDKPLSIKEISGELNISSSKLRTLFHRHMGESLGRYIKIKHMHKVQLLLRSSGLTLSEIAQRTGYQSESSLIRAYKRETGETPIAARKKHRAEKPREND